MVPKVGKYQQGKPCTPKSRQALDSKIKASLALQNQGKPCTPKPRQALHSKTKASLALQERDNPNA
jgi:hypothetical protein